MIAICEALGNLGQLYNRHFGLKGDIEAINCAKSLSQSADPNACFQKTSSHLFLLIFAQFRRAKLAVPYRALIKTFSATPADNPVLCKLNGTPVNDVVPRLSRQLSLA